MVVFFPATQQDSRLFQSEQPLNN
uniref:V-type proton ATPase subunit E n=1 Tax=Rhizophora mucronata TaxID=61149 RepID=A0A2P2J2J5_RHIMU